MPEPFVIVVFKHESFGVRQDLERFDHRIFSIWGLWLNLGRLTGIVLKAPNLLITCEVSEDVRSLEQGSLVCPGVPWAWLSPQTHKGESKAVCHAHSFLIARALGPSLFTPAGILAALITAKKEFFLHTTAWWGRVSLGSERFALTSQIKHLCDFGQVS